MSLQQNLTNQELPCKYCQAKQNVINKFEHLTSLLRKKVRKSDQSKTGSTITFSQRSLSPQSTTPLANAYSLQLVLEKIIFHRLVQCWTNLRLNVVTSTSNLQAELKISNVQIQSFANRLKKSLFLQSKTGEINDKNSLDYSIEPHVKTQFCKLKKSMNFQKVLSRNIFELKIQNQQLLHRIFKLEEQLQEGLRRQQKQVVKKRESLQGLVQQLSEKNQLIEELKGSIKELQNKLGAKQRGVLNLMLHQDSESLKKVVFRLQNINDRLNLDLQKNKNEKNTLISQNKELKQTNSMLQTEVKLLKEENFELEEQKIKNLTMKKQFNLLNIKFTHKFDKIRKLQKKLNQFIKGKEVISPSMIQNILQIRSDRKTTEYTQTATSQRNSSIHNIQEQNKIEAIFSYLFHIQNEHYSLQNAELFDQEEKLLLSVHKQRYLDKLKAQNKNLSLELNTIDKKERTFSNELQCPFGSSVLEAFNEHQSYLMSSKLKQMELQCCNLVYKISELKETQMHIRNVILNFLRSLDLKCLRKQSEGILTVLCDFFQYSQGQRNLFFHNKSKKIFGFI